MNRNLKVVGDIAWTFSVVITVGIGSLLMIHQGFYFTAAMNVFIGVFGWRGIMAWSDRRPVEV